MVSFVEGCDTDGAKGVIRRRIDLLRSREQDVSMEIQVGRERERVANNH